MRRASVRHRRRDCSLPRRSTRLASEIAAARESRLVGAGGWAFVLTTLVLLAMMVPQAVAVRGRLTAVEGSRSIGPFDSPGSASVTASRILLPKPSRRITLARGTSRAVRLTLRVAIGGSITLRSSNMGCSSACSVWVPSGRVLWLTALPAPGYTFSSWGGSCVGAAPICGISPTAATTVTAKFVRAPGELMMTLSGHGVVTSTPSGISCGTPTGACEDGSFAQGTSVELTPAAMAGAQFAGWGGACAYYGTKPCTVQVGSLTGATASFESSQSPEGKSTVTVSADSLLITSAPAVFSPCPSGCTVTASVPSGTTLTLTDDLAPGPPASPSQLSGRQWTGACDGLWPVCTLVVDGDTSVGTEYQNSPAALSDRVTVSVARNSRGQLIGEITAPGLNCPNRGCSHSYYEGDRVYLTARPTSPNVHFIGWWGDCRGTKPVCALTVEADDQIGAAFKAG